MTKDAKSIYPDCASCWLRDSCGDAQPGQFCTMWATREPTPRKPDLNDVWNSGEEVYGL